MHLFLLQNYSFIFLHYIHYIPSFIFPHSFIISSPCFTCIVICSSCLRLITLSRDILTAEKHSYILFKSQICFKKTFIRRLHRVIDRPAISCIQISLRASKAQPKLTTSYRGSTSIYQSFVSLAPIYTRQYFTTQHTTVTKDCPIYRPESRRFDVVRAIEWTFCFIEYCSLST